MKNQNWSAYIPKEKLRIKYDLEVIFEIPKLEIISQFQSVDNLLDKIAESIISYRILLNSEEVTND